MEGRAWNSETYNTTGGGLTSIAFDADLAKNTRSTGDTDDTRTDPHAIDIPLNALSNNHLDERKKRGMKFTTSLKTEDTTTTDRSSSTLWVSKETV